MEHYLGPGWQERSERPNSDDGFVLAETAWHGLNALDVAQSMHIANSPNCFREVGFPTAQLFGDRPSKEEFVISGLLYSVGHHVLSDWFADKEREQETPEGKEAWRLGRTIFHILSVGVKAINVARNHSIGMRPFGEGC